MAGCPQNLCINGSFSCKLLNGVAGVIDTPGILLTKFRKKVSFHKELRFHIFPGFDHHSNLINSPPRCCAQLTIHQCLFLSKSHVQLYLRPFLVQKPCFSLGAMYIVPDNSRSQLWKLQFLLGKKKNLLLHTLSVSLLPRRFSSPKYSLLGWDGNLVLLSLKNS